MAKPGTASNDFAATGQSQLDGAGAEVSLSWQHSLHCSSWSFCAISATVAQQQPYRCMTGPKPIPMQQKIAAARMIGSFMCRAPSLLHLYAHRAENASCV